MTIQNITEIPNPNNKKIIPIKEKQDIYLPDVIDKNIPNRNGFIWLLCGSGGSGKTSMLLNMFKSKNYYRGKFNHLYYICPENSFTSVQNHPFQKHDKVYHELSKPILEQIYQELNVIKKETTKKKEKKKNIYGDDDFDSSDTESEREIEYSCVIIDDYADGLKDKEIQQQLSKMLIKARHICCCFVFTVQSYLYFPKILRKQLTNCSIYKPKNVEEFVSIAKELFNMKSDDALTLFNYCFDKQYNHLDVNTIENCYYKNWNLLNIEMKK
jgi:hypothetical protein